MLIELEMQKKGILLQTAHHNCVIMTGAGPALVVMTILCAKNVAFIK